MPLALLGAVSAAMQRTVNQIVCLAVLAGLLCVTPYAGAELAKTRSRHTTTPVEGVSLRPLAEIRPISEKIDALLQTSYTQNKVKPNPPAKQATFLRRVYLNIIGRIPSYEEAEAYLTSKHRSKRSRLIDRLLDSEGYISHHFNFWADLLRAKSELRESPGLAYVNWIKQSLRENKPYDQFVSELISAEGYVWNNGAAGYYQRDLDMPLDNMANTARVFLGTRLVCAQCHDHPFDDWTQLDFYQMAAYTYGVRARGENPSVRDLQRLLRQEPSTSQVRWTRRAAGELTKPLQYFVHDNGSPIHLPHDYQYDDAEPNARVDPRTIFGDDANVAQEQSRTQVYADWLAAPNNLRFTTVIVNRLWKKVMGVGLIEPVDDIKEDVETSHPELLTLLVEQMIELDYDIKQFLRILYNTKTFQRAVSREEWKFGEPYFFPGPVLRRMSAEQIWDSLLTLEVPDLDDRKGRDHSRRFTRLQKLETATANELLAMARERGEKLREEDELRKQQRAVRREIKAARDANNTARVKALQRQLEELRLPTMTMGDRMDRVAESVDPRWENFRPGLVRASEIRSPALPGHFLRRFGQSDREVIDNTSVEATVPQILTLLNGRLSKTLVNENSVLVRHVNSTKSARKKLQIIFQSILSRRSTASEMSVAMQEVQKNGDQGFGNVVWALINTREFMFIR